ncbi:MAG: flagellar biosynthesis anti-sigma factor FlgM [Gallionellaceae bacterium]|jgi:negative regulator of flagellin synthesis FlgM
MKIDKSTMPLPASQIGELAPKSANAKTGGSNNATSSETSVHLGTSSVQLRHLEHSIATSSVVDKDKVEAIKKAISEGRFQINSGVVADRLIDSVQELISASKSGTA